jgi:hypothetical protein
MNRNVSIIQAVTEGIRQLDVWIRNLKPSDPKMLPMQVIGALRRMHETCSGDVPEEYRDLCVIAVPRLNEELDKYMDTDRDNSMERDGLPVPSFWAAVVKLMETLQGHMTVAVEELESVAELRKQKVSDNQIAGAIYGHRGEGPFLKNGFVQKDLLDQEEKERYSVVPKNWIPPWKKRKVVEDVTVEEQKIGLYRQLMEGPKKKEDPATIAEMLRAGCYVQQIEYCKPGSTREQILKVADEIKVKAIDRPGWVAAAPVAAAVVAAEELLKAKAIGEKPAGKKSERRKSEISAEDRQTIVAFANGNKKMGTPELVELLAEEGIQITSQQLANVLEEEKLLLS